MTLWRGGACGRRYLLEALLDPLVPVAEHVQPLDLSLPGHLHPQLLLTVGGGGEVKRRKRNNREEGKKEEEAINH